MCPYSDFKVSSTAVTGYDVCTAGSANLKCKWGEVTDEVRSYLVGLSVEFYDLPCKNPDGNPTNSASWEKLLKRTSAGCDKDFGKDDVHSILAETKKV